MTTTDFQEIAQETIDNLPEEFKSQLDNVEIVVENFPNEEEIDQAHIPPHNLLLGLYQGVPKTQRFSYAALPDKITIFKQPILLCATGHKNIKKTIHDVVLHEIGHHFGLSEEDLQHIKEKMNS